MRVVLDDGTSIDLGETEATPTIGISDFSRRETDDYGVTKVVRRGFARRMQVKLIVPFAQADALQRQLAALRATPVRWVADDRYSWLDFRGFYKDFSIDLNMPPVSYCTLTVEGLTATENVTDPGTDPAPGDDPSALMLLQPVAIGDGNLIATSVPENDYAEWAAGTTYPVGARVIKAATHRIYESGAVGNVGNDPAGASGKWTDIGPTNRWAMFDQALGSETASADTISLTINAGAVDALVLLDVSAATVRVQAPGFDRTAAPNASGTVSFLDLPETTANIAITIAGTGTKSVGTLVVGKLVGLGHTEVSPSAGITDFSRKETDEFGEVTVVERAWAKRMAVKAVLRTDAIDLVADRIAAMHGLPALWIGADGVETLTIYGFFSDFSIAVDTTISRLSLTVEGLSTAGKVEPFTASVAWPDVTDPLGTKPDDNADVTAENTSKDTAAVGGVPAAQVNDRIQAARDAIDAIGKLTSKNVADIDALVETYGETASAAASASAAKASEDNAKAAATNSATARDLSVGAKTAAEAAQTAADQKARDAAQSASSASGSATTASGQATIATQKADAAGQSASTATAQADIATTKAGEASTSASQAATSESNAAGSSNSAFSSATVSAKSASAATLAADFPLTFAQKGALYRSGGWGGGVPIPDSDFAGAVSGNVYKVGGAYGLAYVRPVPSKGRLLRYQARIRAVGADATLSTDFEYANSPTGPAAGGTFSGFRPLTVAAGWTDVEYPIDGRGTGWAWAYVMPLLRGTAGAGGTVEVEYFRTVDVTDRQAAADYAAASASSAATAGTKASDAGTSAAAALASKTSAETAAGSAATSASQASTSETNAAGSANTASSAQAVTSSVYQSALKATGDQEFVNGVDGYEIVAYGALADVMVLAVDNGRSNLIANKPGKRVGLVSKRRYPITSTTQKFELAASARLAAGPSGSDFYVGYLMFDAAGNRLPAAGIGNYPLFNGYAFANDEWVDSKATIGKSDLAGHQLINPAAASFAPAVFINDRNQNATAIYEVDYVTVRDVTAEVAANAAASSAATAGTKATEAGQLASAAQTSATSAQTFAKNSSDSAKAANDSFTSAQASSTAAGQYAQSASGSANSASTSAGNAKASAEASSGSAAVATDKAAQAASSASLAASYAGGLSGGNMLANSRWLDGLSSWEQVLDVPKFFWGRTNADFGLVEGEHYMGLLGQTRDGASAGAIISEWVTVEPGMTIQISAWLASRECVNSLMIQWGTAARAYLRDAASSEGVGNTHRGSASLSSFKRVGAQAVVPSDARCARFVVQKGAWQANPPNDQSWMFMTRPMMAKVPSGQSGLVDYVFAGPSGGLSAAAAAIDSNALVAAAANQAVAQRTTTLEATTGSQAARLTTTEQVAATALDRTSGARWSKEAVAGNGRAQLTVYAFDSNGNLQSGVDIIGNLTIRGDVFVDGTIYTSKLAPNAAQSIQWARSAGAVSLPANQQTRIMQLTFQKTEAGSTLDLLANLRMKSGDDITGVFRLINFNSGGGIEDSWPIWMVGANDNFQVPIALNWMATGWVPGTYTLAIDYFNQETDAPTWAEAGCTIKVQEIKR